MLGVPAIVREPVGRRTLGQALALSAVRGIVYYPFIGAVFGGVFVLMFISGVPFVSPVVVIKEFGAEIVVRFAPPIAAILVAACSGSTIAAWVGQMTVQRQLDAIAILGVDVGRRILAPIWWGLSVGAVINTFTFAFGIAAVMGIYLATQDGAVAAREFLLGFGEVGQESGANSMEAALVKILGLRGNHCRSDCRVGKRKTSLPTSGRGGDHQRNCLVVAGRNDGGTRRPCR